MFLSDCVCHNLDQSFVGHFFVAGINALIAEESLVAVLVAEIGCVNRTGNIIVVGHTDRICRKSNYAH